MNCESCVHSILRKGGKVSCKHPRVGDVVDLEGLTPVELLEAWDDLSLNLSWNSAANDFWPLNFNPEGVLDCGGFETK